MLLRCDIGAHVDHVECNFFSHVGMILRHNLEGVPCTVTVTAAVTVRSSYVERHAGRVETRIASIGCKESI
jgi:hypothetical protein